MGLLHTSNAAAPLDKHKGSQVSTPPSSAPGPAGDRSPAIDFELSLSLPAAYFSLGATRECLINYDSIGVALRRDTIAS
jgi:hypothetical protein